MAAVAPTCRSSQSVRARTFGDDGGASTSFFIRARHIPDELRPALGPPAAVFGQGAILEE
jgi:hypothetical protein